jgi:hypothetical protein
MATSTIRLVAAGDTVAFARIVAAHHGDMTRVAGLATTSISTDRPGRTRSTGWSSRGHPRRLEEGVAPGGIDLRRDHPEQKEGSP